MSSSQPLLLLKAMLFSSHSKNPFTDQCPLCCNRSSTCKCYASDLDASDSGRGMTVGGSELDLLGANYVSYMQLCMDSLWNYVQMLSCV
uniref:Uncharacterized protein n=1 Tax=Triticum urartu TaxID=4572 RepID=A0A8R7PUY6_TRIUA